MHQVLLHYPSSTMREAVEGTIKLIEAVEAAWCRFENTQGSTMPELIVPSDVKRIFVGGEVYDLPDQRERVKPGKFWFRLMGKRGNHNTYSPQQFHVVGLTRGSDEYQLTLDRSQCGSYEELALVGKPKLLRPIGTIPKAGGHGNRSAPRGHV